MVALLANDITTGSPIFSTGEGVDNSQIVDWYAYFYEPITYVTVSLIQDHNLSATSIETSSAEVQSIALVQNYGLSATSLLLGQPIVANTDLTQTHVISIGGITTSSPVVQSPLVTQKHNLSVIAIVSGQPVFSNVGLSQNTSFQANDIVSGSPALSSPTLQENTALSADSILTVAPQFSQTAVIQNYSLTARNTVTRSPELGEPVDPNAIIAQEIEEIQQMFGGWSRRIYEVPDARLVQAEREIQSTFGDVVSIDKKAKSLLKFGKSAELNADTMETVWSYGGHETYVNDNLIDSISSSNVADNEEIYLECHTVEGTGTDQKFTFMTQTINLNGQSRVPLPTPVARVSKAYNNNGTELVGGVYVYEDTPLTNGVPQDRTKVHAHIPQGFQQSFKAATTFSDQDYYIITGGFGSVSNKQAASVDFYLEVRTAGKIFRQGAAVSASSTGGSWQIDLDPCIIIPRNADIRITCETGSQGAVVFGSFKGYLAKVIG